MIAFPIGDLTFMASLTAHPMYVFSNSGREYKRLMNEAWRDNTYDVADWTPASVYTRSVQVVWRTQMSDFRVCK